MGQPDDVNKNPKNIKDKFICVIEKFVMLCSIKKY